MLKYEKNNEKNNAINDVYGDGSCGDVRPVRLREQ